MNELSTTLLMRHVVNSTQRFPKGRVVNSTQRFPKGRVVGSSYWYFNVSST
ncbi:hypothetical protein [Leptospira noguchii]|uniref:hypothetical protein n=1 Tax=Leptospira noguchii TaxID=28182 RepID=UPI0018DEE70B|nr:hypothetical protein [Leptospira noguchii]